MGSTTWNRPDSRTWVRSLALAISALAAAPIPAAELPAGDQTPPATQPGSEDPAARLYSEALALYRRGEAAGALGPIERALVIAPDRPGLHLLRGWVLIRLARPEDAAEAFQRALHLSPGDPEALTGLGIAALHRGDPAVALAHFADASSMIRSAPMRRAGKVKR
jgi:Flp pilus assembly protein TadD